MLTTTTLHNTQTLVKSLRGLFEEIGVVFKGQGPRYQVLCPFHDDHQPSLSIDDEKGVYFCHSCGEKGNLRVLEKKLGKVDTKLGGGYSLYSGGAYSEQPPFVSAALRAAGKEDVADEVEACGSEFSVKMCQECGKCPATCYHCDNFICPGCYRRHMARFWKQHMPKLATLKKPGVIAIDFGWFLLKDLKEAREKVVQLWSSLREASSPDFKLNGIYHIQPTYDAKARLVNLTLVILVDGGLNSLFFISAALAQDGRVRVTRCFDTVLEAVTFFNRHYNQYPLSMTEGVDALRAYEAAFKTQRRIQGFGLFYPVSGGRMKTKEVSETGSRVNCPFCGSANLKYIGRVSRDTVSWDEEHLTWVWEQGAKLRERRAEL